MTVISYHRGESWTCHFNQKARKITNLLHFFGKLRVSYCTFNSRAEQYCSGAETASKAAFLVCGVYPIRYTFYVAPFDYPVQCEHRLKTSSPCFCVIIVKTLVVSLKSEHNQYFGGIPSVQWEDNSSTCGDSFSTVGIPSVLWRLFSTVGDNISTVKG